MYQCFVGFEISEVIFIFFNWTINFFHHKSIIKSSNDSNAVFILENYLLNHWVLDVA